VRRDAWLRTISLALVVATVGACDAETPPVPAPVQSAAPDFVADCRPCRFLISPALPPFVFTFEIDSTQEGRAVTAIAVQRDGAPESDRLDVHDMSRELPDEKFFFGATDLNGDGNLDLMIATSHGVANTYADYWKFVPQSNRFAYLGNFPELAVDTLTKRLKTSERGGEGGRLFQNREWGFEGDSLVVMREEVQEAASKPGAFVRIVRERTDSAGRSVLREVSREPAKPQ